MKAHGNYESPVLKVTRVALETGIAKAPVSIGVQLHDWEDGGELGDNPGDGGDIYLIY